MIMKSVDNSKEDAVSPVVGVMLMIVVTVVIAAVVISFSGGLAADVEKAPNAVLDVQYWPLLSSAAGGMPYDSPSFRLLYLTGDTNLDTAKMTIVSSWVGTDGKQYSHTFSGSDYADTGYVFNDGMRDWTPFMMRNTDNRWSNYEVDSSWGKYVLSPGDMMITNSNLAMYRSDMSCGVSVILGSNYETISKGTEIDITITYDDHVIFDREVIAQ